MKSNKPSGAENSQDGFKWWISGFVDGEGCFSVSVYRNDTLKIGWQPFPEFTISQNIRNEELLEEIRKFFGCGSVIVNKRTDNHKYDMCKYTVRDLSSLTQVVVPFFERYPLRTHKGRDFQMFRSILVMIQKRKHLTEDGLSEIARIASTMNTKRTSSYLNYLQRLDTSPSD